jgi:hypothetical protein
MEARPTPESTFISTARESLVTLGTSSNAEYSTTRQGELAKRLLAMQREKNKAMEDGKIAILEAKYTARTKRQRRLLQKDLNKNRGKLSKQQQEQLRLHKRRRRRDKMLKTRRKQRLRPGGSLQR